MFALTIAVVVAQVATPPPLVTPDRAIASLAMLAAFVAVAVAGVSLARSRRGDRRGSGLRAARLALALAPLGLVTGGAIVATAEGGVGAGQGLAGGVVAIVVGLVGTTLGVVALARAKQLR